MAHFESVVRGLDEPPIIIGHSAGGAFTQILLDHGCGAAGVALNSAPTEGVPVVPLTQIKSTFEVLKNPANGRAVRYDFEHWNYAFTNTLPEAEARARYERYAVPVGGSCSRARWPTPPRVRRHTAPAAGGTRLGGDRRLRARLGAAPGPPLTGRRRHPP